MRRSFLMAKTWTFDFLAICAAFALVGGTVLSSLY